MMKESVRWGLLLTLVMPPLIAQAQSPATIPWPNGRSVWERSSSTLPGQQYLSYRQAPQQADEPAAAETEPQPLPEPADAPPAPENETPVPTPQPGQSSLYDYSRIHATGMAGSYTTGNYCSDCASGWHLGGWWPRLFSGRPAGSCGGDACGENACAESCCVEPACFACGGCCNWFGGVYGLVLTRSDDGRRTLSYDAANWSTPLLRTSDADTGYQGGAELRFGRYLNDCWAIEANYWGLVPNRSEANVCNRCMNVELTSPILFDNLIYDNGAYTDDVLAWYGRPGDPALRHRLRRKFEAHNIALNLIRNPCRRTGCVHYELLAGIRYFKFDDNFSFATNYTSDAFGNDPVNEMDYVVDTENYLVGFQVGGRMDYYLWGGLSVNAGTALGIYGNHMRHEQFIWGGNGHPWVDGTWDIYKVSRTANDVAFLGDLFAGASYDLTRSWRITCGYRATVASGVAVATSQIPRDVEFVNMVYAPTLDSGDSLVLHGGYAGLEFNW